MCNLTNRVVVVTEVCKIIPANHDACVIFPIARNGTILDCSLQTRNLLLSTCGSTLSALQLQSHACCTRLVANAKLCPVARLPQAVVRHALTASRGGVEAKKFALFSSVLLRFFTSFATSWQRTSGNRSSSLFMFTLLVLVTL